MRDNVKINPECMGEGIIQFGLYPVDDKGILDWDNRGKSMPVREMRYEDESGPGRIVVALKILSYKPAELEPFAYLNAAPPYWRRDEATVFTHAGESSYPFCAWYNSGV